MNNIELLYYLRDAVACLGVLVGIGSAITLFARKKAIPGILALIGFILVGFEPLLDIILFRFLGSGDNPNWDAIDTTYACGSGLAIFLGVILIALALILGFRTTNHPPTDSKTPTELPPTA